MQKHRKEDITPATLSIICAPLSLHNYTELLLTRLSIAQPVSRSASVNSWAEGNPAHRHAQHQLGEGGDVVTQALSGDQSHPSVQHHRAERSNREVTTQHNPHSN